MTDGSLLSPAMQAERLAFAPISEEPIPMGYGLGILHVGPMQGHNGGIVGYSSWMLRDPETDTSIVLVATRGGEKGGYGDAIFYDLANTFFPDRIPSYDEQLAMVAAGADTDASATPVASPAP